MTDQTENLLNERQKTHGDFADHARITQALKKMMHTQHRWLDLNQEHQEALEMIVHKIGRILAGNPCFEDHWDDIAGYAKLGSKACKDRVQPTHVPGGVTYVDDPSKLGRPTR